MRVCALFFFPACVKKNPVVSSVSSTVSSAEPKKEKNKWLSSSLASRFEEEKWPSFYYQAKQLSDHFFLKSVERRNFFS
jgi:hypothetical protein